MRFPSFRIVLAALCAASLGGAIFACSSSTETSSSSGGTTDGGLSRDADPVDVFDGATPPADAGVPPPPLSCTKYCDLVQSHCKGEHAQYASKDDCLAFCEHIPPGDPNEMKASPGMYCRQSYAGSPSLGEPEKYCAAAGPFGGGICGDRCTAFCQVAYSACAPDGGTGPYASVPKCKTECVEYIFKEAGADGGDEGLNGPKTGDTLNCRLYHLRRAVMDASACENIGPDAGDCR